MQAAALRDYILAHAPQAQWPSTYIFVPHRGAARVVREALRGLGAGQLPHIVSLAEPEPLAANLGLALPAPANSWPLRAKALAVLQGAHPLVAAAALIPRTEALLQSLNLLAEYNITPAQIYASVPENLSKAWASHGAALLELWGYAAPRAEKLLPAGWRRLVWANICQVWEQHPPQGPLLWWGPLPETPELKKLSSVLQKNSLAVLPLEATVSPITTLTAATPWEEVQRLCLWVAQQLHAGVYPVAVVASGAVAERLATELQVRFGVKATTTGGTRWGQTVAGVALLQAAGKWLASEKDLSMEYWLNQLPPEGPLAARPVALQRVLEDLAALPNRWSAPVAYAWLQHALEALAGHEEEALHPDARVQILPAHAATQQAFAALAVAQLNEGVWPTLGQTGGLAQAQRRALGLPDAVAQATHAAALLKQLQHQGVGQVVCSRSMADDAGNPVSASRWWPQEVPATPEQFTLGQWVAPVRSVQRLGVWQPVAAPQKLSASLLETLLACPYKAYATRVLGLQELDPLQTQPDPRERGKFLHSWLEAAGKKFPAVTLQNKTEVEDFLLASGVALLATEPPLHQALWAPKLKKLVPAVVAVWAAQGRTLQTEQWLETYLADLKVYAKADALGETPEGLVVMDYKTGTPPTKAKIISGAAPQLALEAWLLQQQKSPVVGLEYWHLKGYGTEPLPTPKVLAAPALVAPVPESLAMVQATYFTPHAAWPAVPDAAGAGITPTGACEHCALQGVCRRNTLAHGVAHGAESGVA